MSDSQGSEISPLDAARRYCADIDRLLAEVSTWAQNFKDMPLWTTKPHPYSGKMDVRYPDGSVSVNHVESVDILNNDYFNSPDGRADIEPIFQLMDKAVDIIAPECFDQVISANTPEAANMRELVGVFESFRRSRGLITDAMRAKFSGDSPADITFGDINNLYPIYNRAITKIAPFAESRNSGGRSL